MAPISFQGLVIPKVIYSAQSKFSGQVDVIKVGETLKIRVDTIDQSLSANSPSARRLVWGRVIDVLKQNQPELKNILILGLGGATVQHFISQDFPQTEIVSVDIDPVMKDIAQKYFDLDKIPNHRVIIDDACRVIIEPENYNLENEKFEVVFVDIYIGQNYPELGKSGNFIEAVKRMAVPGGLIIINRIYTKNHQDDVNDFIDFLEDFLHDIQTYVVAGYTNSDNVLIYGRT